MPEGLVAGVIVNCAPELGAPAALACSASARWRWCRMPPSPRTSATRSRPSSPPAAASASPPPSLPHPTWRAASWSRSWPTSRSIGPRSPHCGPKAGVAAPTSRPSWRSSASFPRTGTVGRARRAGLQAVQPDIGAACPASRSGVPDAAGDGRCPGKKGIERRAPVDQKGGCAHGPAYDEPRLAGAGSPRRGDPRPPSADAVRGRPRALTRFQARFEDLLLDYSKHRITAETLGLLLDLARERDLEGWRRNSSQAADQPHRGPGRPAHGLAQPLGHTVLVDGQDVMPAVLAVLTQMRGFVGRGAQRRVARLHRPADHRYRQYRHRRLGSGPAHGLRALEPYAEPDLRAHFVSNVDRAASRGHAGRGSIPSARCSSSPRKPSPPRRR